MKKVYYESYFLFKHLFILSCDFTYYNENQGWLKGGVFLNPPLNRKFLKILIARKIFDEKLFWS